MSLRWTGDDAALSLGMSKESVAAGTDATRISLDDQAREKRLAAIRTDRARKARALQAQADLNQQRTREMVQASVDAGIQIAGFAGEASEKKAGTYAGLGERDVELGKDISALEAKQKSGEYGWFSSEDGTAKKLDKLQKERELVLQKRAYLKANPWAERSF